ncbi:MAG: hypothetical protein ACE5HB_09765, partial [Terriglobia bacterium]
MRVAAGVLLVGLWGLAVPAGQQAPTSPPKLLIPEAAQPFWAERSYDEWTRAETLEVLTHSPWTRPAVLLEPGTQLKLGKLKYFAQWYSARTVREALVRIRQLQGRMGPQTEEEFLQPREFYQVYLFAGFFRADGGFQPVPPEEFNGMRREDIQQGALLRFLVQDYGSRPDRVEFVRDDKTQQLRGVLLTFQRARGAVPPAEARRGQVKVVCPTKRGALT